MRAVWNDAMLAESDDTVVVEGNHYFPPGSVNWEYVEPSDHHSTCPWKGQASYYSLVVDGQHNPDAAWVYPEPKAAASEIAGPLAFWHSVRVERDPSSARDSGGLLSRPHRGEPADHPATAAFSPMDQRLVPSGWSDSPAAQRRSRAATSEGSRT